MKLLNFGRTLGVAFALVMLGVVGHAAVSPYWQSQTPGVTGPWLGDSYFNIFTLWRAFVTQSGQSTTIISAPSQTSAQANCTQLNSDAMQYVSASASTGYLCLPTAIAGKGVYIANPTNQTIDLYGSATTAVSGTQDFINGTTGTTAYTGLTTGKIVDCQAVATGFWWCASGS